MSEENPVNAEQARHILGGDRICDNCNGAAQNIPCPVCKGAGRIPTPWGRSRMSALKRAMGITNKNGAGRASGARYFFMSKVRKFLRDNPDWTESLVYARKVKAQ